MQLRYIKNGRRIDLTLTFMVIPFIVYVLIFSYGPLWGWLYSIFKFVPGRSVFKSPFIGLHYFRQLFTGVDFSRIMANTLAMSFLGLFFSPLPMIFAILLTELNSTFVKKSVQTITTLPYFVSWIIMFSLTFSLISRDGMINLFLMRIGVLEEPLNVLGNKQIAWYFQTAMGIWKSLGWSAIIYLAAIAGIDQELYDAAAIDGCGRRKRAIHVTVPGLLPVYFVLLLLSISGILSSDIEKLYVFANIRVIDKLETIDFYAYNMGIVYQEYSYGIVVGICKSVVSVVLLFTANNLSKYARGYKVF